MGIIADKTALQIRMLNVGKGAAVFALRAQVDNVSYQRVMKRTLGAIKNITIRQGEVSEILSKNDAVVGVVFACGGRVTAKAVVVATGVYLDSKVLVGDLVRESGPSGFAASTRLGRSLVNLGLELRRFKTSSPPRVDD
jgi:tRNA uridine 5-carboxymethylaminomethyl modification enzyme